jgi:RNA polymerase sigma-70 factor, ECF subfamily
MTHKTPSESQLRKCASIAKSGTQGDVGQLLDGCRPYLLTIANEQLRLQGSAKVTASDIVQETFLDAHRDWEQFAGKSTKTLRSWLRKMLLHNIADAQRRYEGAAKRQISREVDLTPSANWQTLKHVPAQDPSPSNAACERERDTQLETALVQLSNDYRMVILLHYRDGLSFEQIAERMERSVDAVKKLWLRGVKQLQKILASE